MIHAAFKSKRTLKRILVLVFIFLAISVTSLRADELKGDTPCKGDVTSYQFFSDYSFIRKINISITEGAGSLRKSGDREYYLSGLFLRNISFFVEWNKDYQGNSAQIKISYNVAFGQRIERTYNIAFKPSMEVKNAYINGTECVEANSVENFSLNAETLENFGNISWFIDGNYYVGGNNKTVNIAFNDATKNSATITARLYDKCDHLYNEVFSKNVEIKPTGLTPSSVKGSRYACAGNSIVYKVIGSENATSFEWTCPDANITYLDGDLKRKAKITFPTEKTYIVSVKPVGLGCDVPVSFGTSFSVVVNADLNNAREANFKGSEIVAEATKTLNINTCDELYSDCPLYPDNMSVVAQLDLGDEYKYGNLAFDAKVDFELRFIKKAGSTKTLSYTLTINSKKPKQVVISENFSSGTPNNDNLLNLRNIEVIIKSVKIDSKVAQNVNLNVRYKLDFHAEVSEAVLNMASATPDKNEVTFNWAVTGNCKNIPNYQFQLMRLHKADELVEQDWENAYNLFTGNTSTSHKMVLAEGSGEYACRVRAVGNMDDETAEKGSVGAWSNVYKFNYAQFEEDKNWIYSRVITENNKISEKMQYANGLGSAVQQQVRLHNGNSDFVVASQTLQDFSGRDAFKSLPFPLVDKNKFGYVDKLLFLGNSNYTAANFDKDDNVFNPDQATEAGAYYSGSDNGYEGLKSNKGVASDEGFPYSRTVFTNDATGKVREQSSAGLTASMNANGGGKTVKTFYTSASELELIRLLGAEAPKAEDVHKVITVDPNNTSTITYIDKNGKTIATAMSVGSETSLNELASAQGSSRTITENITENTPFGDFGISSSKPLIFTSPVTLTVNYSITNNVIAEMCSNKNFSCDYRVEFWLHDKDLGTSVHDETKDLIIHAGNSAQSLSTSLTFDLEAARNYVLEKRIYTNTSNPYKDKYLDYEVKVLRDYYEKRLGYNGNTAENSDLQKVQAFLNYKEGTKNLPKIDELYSYLATICEKFTVNEQEYYKLKIDCDNYINIPIYVDECEEKDIQYTRGCFSLYFNSVMGYDEANNYNLIKDGEFMNTLVYAPGYTLLQFDDLMDNLYKETTNDGKQQYYFPDLWDDWVSQVNSYKSLVDMKNGVYTNNDETDTDDKTFGQLCTTDENGDTREMPEANVLNWFYNAYANTREMKKYPNVSEVKGIEIEDFYTTDKPSDDQFLHEYKYFRYNESSDAHKTCMKDKCMWTMPLPSPEVADALCTGTEPTETGDALRVKFRALNAENRKRIADCIKNIDENARAISQGSDEDRKAAFLRAITQISTTCKRFCDKRFDEFRLSIVESLNNNGELIEGDKFNLISVKQQDGSVVYKPWGDPIADLNSEYFVSNCEINRLAQATVDNCQNNCVITIKGPDNKIEPQHILNIKNVLNGKYQMNISSILYNCPAPYTGINVKIPDEEQITASLIKDPALNGSCWGPDNALLSESECDSWKLLLGNVYRIPAHYAGNDNDFAVLFANVNGDNKNNRFVNKLSKALVPGTLYRLTYTITSTSECGSGDWLTHQIAFNKTGLVNNVDRDFDEIKLSKFRENYDNQVANIFEVNTLDGTNTETLEFVAMEASEYIIFNMFPADNCQGSFSIGNISLTRISNDCKVTHGICFHWLDEQIITKIPDNIFTPEYISTYEPKPCESIRGDRVKQSVDNQIKDFIDAKLLAYKADYKNQCAVPENLKDNLSISYPVGYHHFTLYYYDRAGNLIKTVPPAGVDQSFMDKSLDEIKTALQGNPELPQHTLVTKYLYNSLGQLVKQHTPDANTGEAYPSKYYTLFYYDNKGRLRFSRSAQQISLGTFSYTKYDELGRVIEVGESNEGTSYLLTKRNIREFPYTGTNQTMTVYSVPANETNIDYSHISYKQRYLNNRVSFTYTKKQSEYCFTWYSYDPHGNVEWILQGVPGMDKKLIQYEYDLLSNKVTKVIYNKGGKDQFFHKYEYDGDNRIVAVYTSVDDVIYDCDVRYEYYAHGPLKRAVIGNDKVQGVDYTYTIQGWLKGINHPSLKANTDPGADGTTASTVPTDAFGMALTYYQGDYVNAAGSFTSIDTYNPVPQVDLSNNKPRNLYNGNISAWATNTGTSLGMVDEGLTAEQYTYDALNRIASSTMNTLAANKWQPINDYATSYTYDPNGNILSLKRNAHGNNGASLAMDDLTYNYIANTNKLLSVSDAVADNAWKGVDVDNQPADNYTYDYNGNLTADKKEKITNIAWNVYGKIEKITKEDGSSISYGYDAGGHRVYKVVQEPYGSGPSSTTTSIVTTYYINDAQGNIMATYVKESQDNGSANVSNLRLEDQSIYGSDRLGVITRNMPLTKYTTSQGSSSVSENIGVTHAGDLRNLPVPVASEATAAKMDMSVAQADAALAQPDGQVGQGNMLQSTSVEDSKGAVLFSFAAYDMLNGVPNVGVVLDKNGNLMYGQAGNTRIPLQAGAKGRTAIVSDVTNNDIYYIYTIGDNGKLYRHKVNMAAVGNGTAAAPLGEVAETNAQPVPERDFLPTMAVMVTDNGRQLYLLEDNGLTPNNINLSMYNITTPDAPVRAQLDRFAGNTDAALMSMSPDGCHLAVAVNKGARGGFMGNTAAGTDLKFYIITTSGETAYILNTCNTGPYVNALSVDFAPDSRYLYFTVGSATSGYRLMRLGAVAKAAEDLIAAGGAASVVRAKNGKLYLAAAGSDALTEVTHNGAAAPQIRQLQLGSAAQGFALTGVLPAQPHTALSNAASTHLFSRTVGLRAFELKDHLGNIRATISDRKLSTLDAYNKPGNFRADLLTAYNYYPFGMLQPGRNYNTNNYRFGFNGKEMDNEAKGTGVQYDYGFRIYDARIAKFLSLDPLTKEYPWYTPYQFAGNMPIWAIDLDGLEPIAS